MRITIKDICNTFRLPETINNRDGKLKIAIKSIGYWVGFYNIYEDQTCQYGETGKSGVDVTIKAGLYNFKEVSRDLRKGVKNLSISLDRTTGLVRLLLPAGVVLWLPEAVKYMLGIDYDNWIEGEYEGDRPVEFLPAGGIDIYLNELSTSNNLRSNLLGNIPMLSENFGQFIFLKYDKPTFIDLTQDDINQLQFELKLCWRNGVQHTLNNHGYPIALELEIK